jgi:hypothetical protein
MLGEGFRVGWEWIGALRPARPRVSEQRERIDSRRPHASQTVIRVVAGRRVVLAHSRIFDRGSFTPVRGMCGAQGLYKLGNITEHFFRCQAHPRRYELILGLSRDCRRARTPALFSYVSQLRQCVVILCVYDGSTMHFGSLEAS